MRKSWVFGALVALAGVLAGPAGSHELPVLPEGDWTEEEVRVAEDLVHRTEEALPRKFGDHRTLQAQGFYDFGVNTPNGYRHFINPAWMADQHVLNPEFPESLVYKDHGGGHLVLEAAMFYLKPEHTMDTIPDEFAWLPGWHVYEELCVDENGQFAGVNGPGFPCPAGSQPSVSPPMMHVWIVDTECGHRFTGLGVTGNMCDVEGHHGGGGHHGPTTTMHPHPDPDPTTPPPAQPIVRPPDQTG